MKSEDLKCQFGKSEVNLRPYFYIIEPFFTRLIQLWNGILKSINNKPEYNWLEFASS